MTATEPGTSAAEVEAARTQPSHPADVRVVAAHHSLSQLQRLSTPSIAADALCESRSSTPDTLLATVRTFDADDEESETDNDRLLGALLISLGLGRYASVFAAEAIDGETLLMLGADANEASNNGGSHTGDASFMCDELLPAATEAALECLRKRHECMQLGNISSLDDEQWAPLSYQTRSPDVSSNDEHEDSEMAIARQLASADLRWLTEVLRILLQRESEVNNKMAEKITQEEPDTTSTIVSAAQESGALPVNDAFDDSVDGHADDTDIASNDPQEISEEGGFAQLLAAARSSVEEEAQRVLAEAAPAGNMAANGIHGDIASSAPETNATVSQMPVPAISEPNDGRCNDDASNDLFGRREAAKWAEKVAEQERERRIAEAAAHEEGAKRAEELERSKRTAYARKVAEEEMQRRIQAQHKDALAAQLAEEERRNAARNAANACAAQELQRHENEWRKLCTQQAAEWKAASERRDEARR